MLSVSQYLPLPMLIHSSVQVIRDADVEHALAVGQDVDEIVLNHAR
jgi:hypothetical protein